MSSLYEQFDCRIKEELYEKVKNQDLQVKLTTIPVKGYFKRSNNIWWSRSIYCI